MVRVVEFVHFGKDRRPKRLSVDEFEPGMNEKGYPREGSYIIAIEDDDGRKAFGLTEAEAALLAHRLTTILTAHSNDYMNLWGMVKKSGKDEG